MNHDDFDQFLKGSSDGLRMHPSERVWQNISRELDRKKKRLGGWFALSLFLISGLYITYEVVGSTQRQQWATQTSLAVRTTKPGKPATVAPLPSTTNTTAATTAILPAQRAAPARLRKKTAPPQQLNTDTPIPPETAASGSLTPPPLARLETASADSLALFQNTELATHAVAPAERIELPAPSVETPQLKEVSSVTVQTANPEPVVTTSSKSSRLSWQIFATPTISYRVLSDNKSYRRPMLTTNIPANFSALYGINDAVIHKPDLGIEFGVMGRYALSKSLRLRTGFQFNVSRYDIKAFSFVPEVTTIALNNGPRVDSVRAISNYRNFAGGRTNWLQNFYFQASMPVGLELTVAGTNKMHWGVASSIQPTYIIGNRSYMITADYKNYARVPWLSRRWNMNTSFETYVSINSGKTQWQVGPQVRYQVLSSFIREYPVKENLFDFGLKVGVTLK